MNRKIWKRTIIIYTDYDPEDVDIEDLSRDAMAGNGCYTYYDEEVDDVTEEPELATSEFFHQFDEDQDDE